jgi:AcrR family transcriptional regulator
MPAPTPLRRGPANPEASEQIRTRILDAAHECLLEMGVTGRLHAQIAQRAGVSRPTVYKYVGDQAAILNAVFEREFERFVEAVVPSLRAGVMTRSDLLDGVVLIVQYARGHELLAKSLRDQPEYVLPVLTTNARPLIDQVTPMFARPLGEILGDRASVPVDVAVEWFFRIIVSLIVTPPPTATSSRALRRYVDGLVDLLSE